MILDMIRCVLIEQPSFHPLMSCLTFLIDAHSTNVPLDHESRDMGLFQKNHVWLTTIDLSDSIARLDEPSDFNGLIMADAMWSMPETPAFERFMEKWISLDREK